MALNDDTCPLDKFLIDKCRKYPHVVKSFIRFLCRHGAYEKYVFNYTLASDFWKSEFQVEGGDPYHLFSRAFSWDSTPQGIVYWNDLDILWRRKLIDNFHIPYYP